MTFRAFRAVGAVLSDTYRRLLALVQLMSPTDLVDLERAMQDRRAPPQPASAPAEAAAAPTVSKWLGEWETLGLVSRETAGRRKRTLVAA
jgi:predicted transcriptional regulator